MKTVVYSTEYFMEVNPMARKRRHTTKKDRIKIQIELSYQEEERKRQEEEIKIATETAKQIAAFESQN